MRPWMARPRKQVVRREIAETVAFLFVLAFVVVAMSVDWPA